MSVPSPNRLTINLSKRAKLELMKDELENQIELMEARLNEVVALLDEEPEDE